MIRMLIVDENLSICEQLLATLSQEPDFEVVGFVKSFQEAREQVQKKIDLILASSALPEDGAYRLTRLVRKEIECTQVLITGDDEPPTTVVRYLEAGASGFVKRSAVAGDWIEHIRTVLRGEALLPPDLAGVLLLRLAELGDLYEDLRTASDEVHSLTRREREVLYLIGRDFTNQDIANHLIIEVGTVKNHVHNILAKLKVSSRREAATFASISRDRLRLGRHSAGAVSSDPYVT